MSWKSRKSKKKILNPGGGVEVLGCQKMKNPGNVMNCPENRYIFFNLSPRVERGRGGWEGGDRELERRGRQAGKEGPERSRVTS